MFFKRKEKNLDNFEYRLGVVNGSRNKEIYMKQELIELIENGFISDIDELLEILKTPTIYK